MADDLDDIDIDSVLDSIDNSSTDDIDAIDISDLSRAEVVELTRKMGSIPLNGEGEEMIMCSRFGTYDAVCRLSLRYNKGNPVQVCSGPISHDLHHRNDCPYHPDNRLD